jgi:hypothetical protein
MLGNRFHVRSYPFRNRFACDGRCLGSQEAEAAEHYSTIKISEGDSAQKTLSQMLMLQGSETSIVLFNSLKPPWKALQMSHSEAFTATKHFLPTVCKYYTPTCRYPELGTSLTKSQVKCALRSFYPPTEPNFPAHFPLFHFDDTYQFHGHEKNEFLNSEFCNR